MGKLLSIVLAALLSSSCAAGISSINRHGNPVVKPCTLARISPKVDAEILPYVEEFLADANYYDQGCSRVKDVILSDKVKTGIAGYCQPGFAVVLSRPFWEASDEWERRTLVYHELGHCSLNLDHTEEEAIAIMNPYILPSYLASRNWPSLVRTLMEKK